VTRSRETHEAHCMDLDGPLHNHLATTYGLNFDSVLNSSRYFHVVDGVIPDIMHGKPASSIVINSLVTSQSVTDVFNVPKQ